MMMIESAITEIEKESKTVQLAESIKFAKTDVERFLTELQAKAANNDPEVVNKNCLIINDRY